MTARLSLSRADVEGPAGTRWEKVMVQSSKGTMRITRRGAVLVDQEVMAVRPMGRRRWELDAPDGTWVVTAKKGGG